MTGGGPLLHSLHLVQDIVQHLIAHRKQVRINPCPQQHRCHSQDAQAISGGATRGELTEHCMVLRIDCPDGDEVQSPKSRDQNLNGRCKSGHLGLGPLAMESHLNREEQLPVRGLLEVG